ncbi:eukaryotic translation initiation factor 3 subunit 7-like protein [Leptomonas pyrrhocoris]|uniref:Eukaryotic translation initiation factor 3 subunit 7-like protein n=1 Tax=Leptomonas pyrrhocoris TaxID=157538 RepID=A0A0N0DY07_LEPPY|nr:eukaryotic translation initiation factor 3 subunit 7-like protein [Leptomonas pyrrhocoris]KPA83422.1 eukaryotic translation initiation factor 3 subunit 7-like protein [Leptomonas pyrrhocoris]|eukprot:XP_015661861.1 eukaryotic translation initiation factor 3 subunit 7-like protein [Leptomonas pyrrhocoris]
MSFELPKLYINPQFTWGPPEEELVMDDGESFELYSKMDPLLAVDWYSFKKQEDEKESESDDEAAANKRKAFVQVEDNARLNALRSERAKVAPTNFRNNARNAKGGMQNAKGGKDSKNTNARRNNMRRKIAELSNTYNASAVAVVQQVIKQTDMTKLRMAALPKVVELGLYGTPPVYNTAIESATCARPVSLDESKYDDEFFLRGLTTEDPELRKIMGETQRYPLVVVTDEILSLLMVCSRSSYPWHIRVLNYNNIWILVKREDSSIDKQWVSETAGNDIRPSEAADNAAERISALGEESTKVYDCFTRAACTKSYAQVKVNKSPFSRKQPRMYSYRRYILHDGTPERYDIVVRCEVDAVMPKTNDRVRTFALLEQCVVREKDSSWRREGLLKNAASFLPIEYANNGCKIARWTALSLLSDAKLMKIGFVTCEEKMEKGQRVFDHKQHEILTVQTYSPASLATQFGIEVSNMWAIVDHILRPFIDGQSICPSILMKPGDKPELIVVEEEDDDDSDEDDSDEEEDDDEEEEDNEDAE